MHSSTVSDSGLLNWLDTVQIPALSALEFGGGIATDVDLHSQETKRRSDRTSYPLCSLLFKTNIQTFVWLKIISLLDYFDCILLWQPYKYQILQSIRGFRILFSKFIFHIQWFVSIFMKLWSNIFTLYIHTI